MFNISTFYPYYNPWFSFLAFFQLTGKGMNVVRYPRLVFTCLFAVLSAVVTAADSHAGKKAGLTLILSAAP